MDRPSSPPNLILILCDQLRRDSLGVYGNRLVETPNLDRLAAGSVRFGEACTTAPICSPARASLFSGKYPQAAGVWFNNFDFPDETPLVFEELAKAGYVNHYYGKWHLGKPTPAQRGIARFVDAPEHRAWLKRERSYPDDALNANARMHFGPGKPKRETSAITAEDYFDHWITDRALEGLDELSAGEAPFFLTLSLHAPHPPYSVPRPYSTMVDPATVKLPETFGQDPVGKPKQIFTEWGYKHANNLTGEDWKELIAHYQGLVAYADGQIGRFLTALEEHGLAENSVVIFTSDHGDMLGEWGFFGKHNYAYDSVMRVPFFVRAPGAPAGERSAPASLVDLAPTLLDYAGGAVPGRMQGISLRSVVEDAQTPFPREAAFEDCNLFEHFFIAQRGWSADEKMLSEVDTLKAARTPEWKYIMHRFGNFEELYDLRSDPREQRNLLHPTPAPPHRERADHFRGLLSRWMQETGDPHCQTPWFQETVAPYSTPLPAHD